MQYCYHCFCHNVDRRAKPNELLFKAEDDICDCCHEKLPIVAEFKLLPHLRRILFYKFFRR